MSDVTTPATDSDWEDVDDVSWTLLNREELVDAYWAVVAPAMEADGLDPDQEKPTHSWLRNHDFRPLLYALWEYHDVTFGEFWPTDLGLKAEATGYNWAIDHDRTIEAFEYKCDREGTHFVAVTPRGTRKECAACGVSTEKPLWVREHSCPTCGFEADRDANAVVRLRLTGSKIASRFYDGVEHPFSRS